MTPRHSHCKNVARLFTSPYRVSEFIFLNHGHRCSNNYLRGFASSTLWIYSQSAKKDDIRLQTIMHRLSGAYSLHFPSQRFDILQNENVDFIQTQKKIVIWILFLFDEINLHISLRLVRVIGLIQAHCGVRLNVEMITLAGSSNDYELGEDLVIRCFSENSMVWCSYLVNILRHILCWNLDITEADHTDYIESWRHWY